MPMLVGTTISEDRLVEAQIAYTTKGPNKTSKDFGLSPNTFRRIAREKGWLSPREVLEKTREGWKQDELDEIIKRDYPTMGARLAFLLNFSEEKIRKDAVRLGVDSAQSATRKQNVQTLKLDYFKTWSPTMAYDTGYIWADGATHYREKTKDPDHLTLKCKEGDEEMILAMRDRLGSNHMIKRGLTRQVNGAITPYCRIAISTRELTRSLIEDHGILPGKSKLDLPFPTNIPSHFLHCFTRGYFDGDGSCGQYMYEYRTNPQVVLSLQGSCKFIFGLSAAIYQALPELSIYAPTETTCGTWIIQWQSTDDIRLLYQWLYPTEGIYPYLARKRKLLEEILGLGD